jgi:hypothetical protein
LIGFLQQARQTVMQFRGVRISWDMQAVLQLGSDASKIL